MRSLSLKKRGTINEIWEEYSNPKPPFSKRNLRVIGKKLFILYEKRKGAGKIVRPKRIDALDSAFPKVILPSSPKTGFVIHPQQSLKKGGGTLLLEVLKETGAGGTQVQIPKEVVSQYFKVLTTGHQTIEVSVAGSAIRPAVICHFGNNTHRITFTEIAKIKRPFLMKFIRKENVYFVFFIIGQNYKENILRCKNQTRYSAKKWDIF